MNIDTLGAAIDAIETIEAETDGDRIANRLAAYLRGYGLLHVLITGLPEEAGDAWHRSIIFDGWPIEWFDRYTSNRHFRHDPCIAETRMAAAPFLWADVVAGDLTAEQSRVMSEAADFALKDGVCVPIHIPYRPPWVVSAAGPEAHVNAANLRLIEMVSFHAFRSLMSTMGSAKQTDDAVPSFREREVLSWIAAGKSSEDVACILGISRHTVERHLSNVRAKFGAINTVHAVTRAIRRGDIRP